MPACILRSISEGKIPEMRFFTRRRYAPVPLHVIAALEGSQSGMDGLSRMLHGIVIEKMPEIQVKHVIERKIPPRPTVIQAVMRGVNGQEYRTDPINATLRHTVPVYFPLHVLTGNQQDVGTHCMLTLELHYDPRTDTSR